MSEQAPHRKKRQPMLYVFNNKEFTSVMALLNHLTSLNLLHTKPRVIVCKYCGATLSPVSEANHYFSKHREQISLK